MDTYSGDRGGGGVSEDSANFAPTHPRQDLIITMVEAATVQNVNLAEQNITFEQFVELVAPVFSFSQWISFDISGNMLGPRGGATMAGILTMASSLRELNLSHNQLGDEGVIEIFRVLPHTNLTRLELEGNYLTDRCVLELARTLNQSKVQELLMSYNHITDQGLLALCPVIGNLKILDLFSNQLSDEGITALSQVIPACMTELYLGGNVRVGDGGIVALSRALAVSNVRILGLMENSITDVGVNALTEAAKVSHLTEVLLNRNPWSCEARERLERVLLVCDSAMYKTLIVLCSVREITRLGVNSSFKAIPIELIRKIALAIYDPADIGGVSAELSENEEDSDEGEDEGVGDVDDVVGA